MPLLHDATKDGKWRAWLDHFGRPDMDCHAGQHFSETGIMIEAAAHGLGVALARASLVADHLINGALVCPLRLAVPTAFSYYLLGLPEAVHDPRIAAFRAFLLAEAAETDGFIRSFGAEQPGGTGLDVHEMAMEP